MKRRKALVLAAFTIWPLLYAILIIATIIFVFTTSSIPYQELRSIMRIAIPLHVFTMLDLIVLTAIYIVYVLRTDGIPQYKKVLWALILFFGNIDIIPVFWYLYIWRPLKKDCQTEQFDKENTTD